jgi:transcriptional regulator with XRE-family HTH domain
MNASDLQEHLRRVLWERIRAGQLTGLGLAKQTGFEQAHISNFLNRKRSLSLEGMDRILSAQQLSVPDLIPAEEINRRTTSIESAEGEFENVLLVESSVAATQAIVERHLVKDVLKFKKSFLRRLRSAPSPGREEWHRFLMIKVDAQEAASMYPRLLPGATVLIDRHYNLLQPYRRNEPNIYAVKREGKCTIRYVERESEHLVLRPHNQAFPVTLLPLQGPGTANLMVGRICHVAIET